MNTIYCVKSGHKLPVFPFKKIKIFLLEFLHFCDISFVLTLILARNYFFKGKNMSFKMVQNKTGSNGRIKKTTLN